MHLLLLLFVPAVVHGFSSSFNYGCQNGKCNFQLVVPKEVAQFIDENALSSEVTKIATDLISLNNTISTFNDSGATDFTQLFDANYNVVNAQATDLNTSVNVASQNATDLVTASANSNATANLLYQSMACFKNTTLSSYTCFSLPSTAAPATTAAASTTGNPSTGDSGSTVSGESTAPPASTLPFTGTTVTGGSAGSTAIGGSTATVITDASTPSTSAGAPVATTSTPAVVVTSTTVVTTTSDGTASS